MGNLRTVSSVAAAILEHVAAARRRTISLPGDAEWLSQISATYPKVLDGMEERRNLYRVLQGNYVVAPRATEHPDQAAPPELLVDLVLRDRSPYYLAFLTAMIGHGLTDLHTSTLYAAIPQGATTSLTTVDLAGTTLRIVRLSKRLWPVGDEAFERRRALPRTREFFRLSSLGRTLVDTVLRPDLSGGIEAVVHAWSRAQRHDDFDAAQTWKFAQQTNIAGTKRVAFMLRALGHGVVVEDDLKELRRKRSRILLDRTDDYGMASAAVRDRATGVTINLPDETLTRWLADDVG